MHVVRMGRGTTSQSLSRLLFAGIVDGWSFVVCILFCMAGYGQLENPHLLYYRTMAGLLLCPLGYLSQKLASNTERRRTPLLHFLKPRKLCAGLK
jgi:uncharacterized membrane protein YbhN (UPF0104 family)